MKTVNLTLDIGLHSVITDDVSVEDILERVDIIGTDMSLEAWEQLSGDDQRKILDKYWKDWAWEYINGSAELIKE